MSDKKKKILILRFGAIGDIVHTTAMTRAIKNKYPDYKIFYCVENRYRAIIENTAYIDKIISYDENMRKDLKYNLKFALDLRKEKFDVIFNLTNALRNNLLSIIANPVKIIKHKKDRGLHVVGNFFETAQKAFPDIELPSDLALGIDENVLKNIEEKISVYPKPYIVFSPAGSNDAARQGRIWNKNYWKELGKKLIEEYGGTLFITGATCETEFHNSMFDGVQNVVLLSGKLGLKESMCLYKLADLFIAGDTGPLHLASALGVNTLGIYGSTDAKNVRPYGNNGFSVCPDDNACRFCWQKRCKYLKEGEKYTPCMEGITPEKVLSTIKSNKLL